LQRTGVGTLDISPDDGVFDMTDQTLSGIRVAILATDGFEQSELMEPRSAMDAIGADTVVVSPKRGAVRGWSMKQWGDQVAVDQSLAGADPDDYDALLLPGGVINADALRMIGEAVEFVAAFFDDRKPVGAICHAPWLLIESGNVKGRTLTSWPSLKTDLINGGAHWVNQEVVVDGQLVTSRKPDDIPSFNREITRLFDRIGRQHERNRQSDNPRRAV
jgi:protease I